MGNKSDKRSASESRHRGSEGREKLLDQVMGEVHKHIPSDLARRLEKGVAQGQKVVRDNLGQARRQLEQAATRADVENLTVRLDRLTHLVEAMVSGAAEGARSARAAQRGPARPARSSAGPRPAATATAKPASRAAAKPAAKSAAPRSTSGAKAGGRSARAKAKPAPAQAAPTPGEEHLPG